MMVAGQPVVFYTSRAQWTAGDGTVRCVPMRVSGFVAEVTHRSASPCGYDVVKLKDGRTFERPDTFHPMSPYDWTQVTMVRVEISSADSWWDGGALTRELPPRPQSVQEWIDECNRIEREQGDVDDQPRLTSGWWILPGLLGGAFVFAWVASRLIAGAIE